MEGLKKQIASMKNKVLCESCGNQNEEGSSYCTKCGAKLSNCCTNTVKESEEDDFTEFDD